MVVLYSTTTKPAERYYGAPYYMGKSHRNATMDFWEVLQMFWGTGPKERLLKLIFGDSDKINALAEGSFTVALLEEGSSHREMRAKVQYMPLQVEDSKRFGADFDPASIEIKPLQNRNLLVGGETFSLIMDEHSVTFTTSDPVNSLLPHSDLLMLQCLLIRALWMAGRHVSDL